MRAAQATILAAGLALSGCRQAETEQTPANGNDAPASAVNAAQVAHSNGPVANEAERPADSSLPEPKGPIDPKSVEAAGQVVQHYGALVEQGRFLQAGRLWGDLNAARGFAAALDARFNDVHVEIGDLGTTEGAAGSIYTNVPVVFYGTSEQGAALRMPASIVLRRVNDVPGSTERQRSWHIERIEWQPKAG